MGRGRYALWAATREFKRENGSNIAGQHEQIVTLEPTSSTLLFQHTYTPAQTFFLKYCSM